MAESEVFEWVSAELETRTSLSRLEARGTLRLLLKSVGLDPGSVSAPQMTVVLSRLLAPQLVKRKVEAASDLCQTLTAELGERNRSRPETNQDTAYEIFARLDSSTTGRLKR
ncbi:MAG: hypothetical protein IPI67_10770 [Myxococcales bacterium]|nr:hypothetical protein [Myxococcales bacterium]